ncbi:MAG: phosphate ABC transporter permease subunit PstC [Oscillospiraceae bacterium]|nr:phosphate ABC transporter permease subunit PstC [Oscillospiraceae bacterium]
MRKIEDRILGVLVGMVSLVTVLLLAFLIFFIVKESLPAICEVGLKDLLLGNQWRPIIFKDAPSYGLRNMILSTVYVSVLAVLFALVIGVGCALCLACSATERQRTIVMPYIDLLASVPSVVYGFIGLYIVIKLIEKCGRSAGESVLAGGIVLSVMILPYMVASCCDTMVRIKNRYDASSQALGVSKWYMAAQMVLPASVRGILISVALATGRAMGETMAVMMVMGNAIAKPSLLGKGETISALIALEMGMAEVGSIHYSALYAAGLTLMFLLFGINLIFEHLKRKLSREGSM